MALPPDPPSSPLPSTAPRYKLKTSPIPLGLNWSPPTGLPPRAPGTHALTAFLGGGGGPPFRPLQPQTPDQQRGMGEHSQGFSSCQHTTKQLSPSEPTALQPNPPPTSFLLITPGSPPTPDNNELHLQPTSTTPPTTIPRP